MSVACGIHCSCLCITVAYRVSFSQRQKSCMSLIERDDKFRQSVGLSTPSLEEVRLMKGVKRLRGADRKSLLIRVGVLERPRPAYRRNSRDFRGGYENRRRSVCVGDSLLRK